MERPRLIRAWIERQRRLDPAAQILPLGRIILLAEIGRQLRQLLGEIGFLSGVK